MRASNSSDSSSTKRIPLTVPAVPTGMKTGVSIIPRRVASAPARASPSWAINWKLIGGLSIDVLVPTDQAISCHFSCVFQVFGVELQRNQTLPGADFADDAHTSNA